MKPTPLIKIESGVPIPGRYSALYSAAHAALETMKPGQSFMLPDQKLMDALYASSARAKIKITARKVNGEGYRVWRVS